ncbi:hypothetical protein N9W21_03395 [Shewanella sp.]|nr:hypothetical protein [Shewanella sp.]
MTHWITTFDSEQWLDYERALLLVVAIILAIWFCLCLFKPQGKLRWSLIILCCASFLGLCFISRVNALQLSSLLTQGRNIEILDGPYHYGRYHFPYTSAHGLDYRELRIGERVLKIYHSGYLMNARCYQRFFSSNEFKGHTQLRLYIHWNEREIAHKNAIIKINTPCILRIDSLSNKRI